MSIAIFGKYEVEPICFENDHNSHVIICEEKNVLFYGVYRRNKNNLAVSVQDFKVKNNALEYAEMCNQRDNK